MGRAKLKMEYMADGKKRNKTYKIRKESLLKKMHELTTLCDVKACAIIYHESNQEPEIWPNDREKVHEMIEMYKSNRPGKTYTLSDFYSDKKREIKEELNTIRKKNREDKYPSWDPALDALKEPELREFAGMLGDKLNRVHSRIEELKRRKSVAASNQEELSQAYWNTVNQQQGIPTPRPIDMILPHGYCYPGPAEQQLNQLPSVYQNHQMSMPTMLMNSSGDQAFYNQSNFGFGAVNPMIYDNQQGPVGAYYTGLQLLPPEWLQFMPRDN